MPTVNSGHTVLKDWSFSSLQMISQLTKAVMLSVCGAETYKLLRSLCAPNNPLEKTYDQLRVLMKKHLRVQYQM